MKKIFLFLSFILLLNAQDVSKSTKETNKKELSKEDEEFLKEMERLDDKSKKIDKNIQELQEKRKIVKENQEKVDEIKKQLKID